MKKEAKTKRLEIKIKDLKETKKGERRRTSEVTYPTKISKRVSLVRDGQLSNHQGKPTERSFKNLDH